MKKNKGFTLIELLVVIAIIGLLATLAVVSLNNARQKSRDAKRVSDVKQIQTSLELYYSDESGYPTALDVTSGTGTIVGPTSGVTYMGKVPKNPTPGATAYTYTGSTSTYTITFSLESGTGGLASGAHTATPSGIQ